MSRRRGRRALSIAEGVSGRHFSLPSRPHLRIYVLDEVDRLLRGFVPATEGCNYPLCVPYQRSFGLSASGVEVRFGGTKTRKAIERFFDALPHNLVRDERGAVSHFARLASVEFVLTRRWVGQLTIEGCSTHLLHIGEDCFRLLSALVVSFLFSLASTLEDAGELLDAERNHRRSQGDPTTDKSGCEPIVCLFGP